MSTWYEVVDWKDEITPVKVVAETAQTITVVQQFWGKDRKSRTCKQTADHCYFPTEREAREFILTRTLGKIHRLKRELAAAEESLARQREDMPGL